MRILIALLASCLLAVTAITAQARGDQASSLRLLLTCPLGGDASAEPLRLGLRWQGRATLAGQELAPRLQWEMGLDGWRGARFNGLPLYQPRHLNEAGQVVESGPNYWIWGLAAAGAGVAALSLGGAHGGSSGGSGGLHCGSDEFHQCDGRASAICGSPPNQRLDDDGDCSTTYDNLGPA